MPADLGRGARVLLELVALLEPDDRTRQFLELWFPDLWHARGAGDVPGFEAALGELLARGLVSPRHPHVDCSSYHVDEELEQSILSSLGPSFAADFAQGISRLWAERFFRDRGVPDVHSVRAGIAASVYAARGGKVSLAFDLLEQRVLPIACQTGEARYVLLHLLRLADADEKNGLKVRFDAIAQRLAKAHIDEGHADQALETIQTGLTHAVRNDLGPASLAKWLVHELDALYNVGRHEDVLDRFREVLRFFDRSDHSSLRQGPWLALREQVLHHGAGSAKALKRWHDALEINQQTHRSLEQRGASASERASYRFGDYAPLLEIGEIDRSEALLLECQAQFEADGNHYLTALVLGARAIVADRRGDTRGTYELRRRELEVLYRAPRRSLEKAHAHRNYANHQWRMRGDLAECGAHWMAAAIIYDIAGNAKERAATARSLELLPGAGSAIPGQIDEIVKVAERIPGVRIGDLLATLATEKDTIPRALARIRAAMSSDGAVG